jgi:hypothetical protein
MKNNQAMNLSDLAANGTALELAIAEVQGVAKIKRLPTRGPRKGETLSRGQAGGRPSPNGNRPTGAYVACNGGWAANGQVGYGAQQVSDLDAVKARYARVIGAEKREAAREEAARRRAEREAAAFAALDDLLSEV